MLFSHIPQIPLLNSTPLDHLANLGEAWHHPALYLKRDDLLGLGMGGNKVRSLEFWFGEALAQQADLVLVEGQATSNQCRAVAATARRFKIECHIVHNSPEPTQLQGNDMLNNLMATKRIYLGAVDEVTRRKYLENYAAEQKAFGRRPYIVGDQVLGALGYVKAALEVHAQASMSPYNIDFRHLVICGAGGPTESGLLWGASLLGRAFKVHICSSEFPKDELTELILRIYKGVSQKINLTPPIDPREILNVYDFELGAGYDIPTPSSIAAIRELAETEGVFMESTYNGKVLAALKTLISDGIIPANEAVCLFHTGGIPALLAQGERFI